MNKARFVTLASGAATVLILGPALAAPIGTAFTYQGQLKQAGTPVNATVDFEFALWDAETGGSDINDAIVVNDVEVVNGLFTVELDFETDIYSSAALWMELKVRSPAGSGDFTTLAPRQRLTPVPLALALPGLQTRENSTSPNIIAGWSENRVTVGVAGAVVGGGGAPLISNNPRPNLVTDNYGIVAGGSGNRAGNNAGTSDDANHATVSGGYANLASASVSTVGGGWYNRATGDRATIPGGWNNLANKRAATVGGGRDNQATGTSATVPGGHGNYAAGDYSFAAGWKARASHNGAFVWADSIDTIFESTAANQFLIRAGGGVGIGTTSPGEQLTVNGTIESLSGGFKFPDGTVQSTAGGGEDSPWQSSGSDISYTAGNVGIGTTEAGNRLHVVETANGSLTYPFKISNRGEFAGTTAGMLFQTGPEYNRGKGAIVYERTHNWQRGSFHILQDTVDDESTPDLDDAVVTVTNYGKVGIGTTSPAQKLSVAGAVESTSGGFKFPDGTVQVTAGDGGNLTLPYSGSTDDIHASAAFAVTHAALGVGVKGIHGANSNYGYLGGGMHGAYGQSSVGVSGMPPVMGAGVLGVNTGPGQGVRGESDDGTGVRGEGEVGVAGIGQVYGVYGLSTGGHAGYFDGDGYFSGDLGIGTTTPGNLFAVHGEGTVLGGADSPEVVARFKRTGASHTAAAIDSESGRDSILYFAESGDAHWDIRHDTDNSDSLNIRYHGGTDENWSVFRILSNGTTRVRVLEIVGGADLAEPFNIAQSEKEAERAEPGMVVVIDPDHPGQLRLAGEPYDRKVAGVISGAKGLKPGMVMKAEDGDLATGDHPVALTGRVWCWCDSSSMPIRPGDLLTTSTRSGHAMKVTDHTKAQGAILGKAMTSLEEGTGLVLVLVTLQ